MNYSYKDMVKMYKKGNVVPKTNSYYESSIDNKNAWYLFYKEYFASLITSLFEWKNLPDGIDPIFLEQRLNEYGFVGFFEDKEKGFIVQSGVLTDDFDLYGNPIKFTVVSPVSNLLEKTHYELNNYIDDLDRNKAFLISNDGFRNSSYYWIDLFSVKLANIEQSIEIARNSLKVPYVILTDEENKLSVRNFYQKVHDGEPVIFIKDNKSKDGMQDRNIADKIQILNINNIKTNLLKDLYEEKVRVFNQFLNFIGITSNNNDKKERLVSDEVNADDGLIATKLESKLKARRKAIDLINKCYNLNIEVNMSPSIEMHNLDMLDDELSELDTSLPDLNVNSNSEIEVNDEKQ